MQITFSPQRRSGTLAMAKAGDVLTINGAPLDFSGLIDSHLLPPDAIANEFLQDARRVNGQLQVTVILPLADDASNEAKFPDVLTDVGDGDIAIPGGANDE